MAQLSLTIAKEIVIDISDGLLNIYLAGIDADINEVNSEISQARRDAIAVQLLKLDSAFNGVSSLTLSGQTISLPDYMKVRSEILQSVNSQRVF